MDTGNGASGTPCGSLMASNRDALEKTLERLQSWIKAADAKTAPVLAIDTAMLGVLATFAPPSMKGWTMLAAIAASIAGILLLASLVFLFLAAFPRTEGPKKSCIYWEGITQRDMASYVDEMLNLGVAEYAADLARQCHRNAEIARDKFACVKRAMFSLFLAILPWLSAVAFLYEW